MTSIALVLGKDRSHLAKAVASSDRNRDATIWFENAAAAGVAVATLDWQERLSGGSVGRCQHIQCVADATLYYRDDLIRQLRAADVQPASHGSGDLIAAAVLAWGDEAAKRLEGDFAYIAFDTRSQAGHAARDPVGGRPLFFCSIRDGLAIASSPTALVKSGVCPADLNTDWLAELCAGAVNVGNECAYRAISALRQGERLRFNASGVFRVDSWYEPPSFTERGASKVKFADAAQELRELVVAAVRERVDPGCLTVVTLSGGRDSSAVYAAGRRVAGDNVRSVSLSYPVGNSGREDETISEIIAACGGSPRWVEATRIPLLAHLEHGERRHDAFRHPYEATTNVLCDNARASGARVVLNGLGGDTLFHAERSYLSDLLMTGRWVAFRNEMRLQRVPLDARSIFRWGILPRMGPASRSFIARLRRRRVHDVWDEPLPTFARLDPARFVERAWSEPYRKLRRGGAADRERRLIMMGPFAGRVAQEYVRISRLRGVEQRSPLYDMRLVRFAASRPRSERQFAGDYKRLLRESMKDWLPTSVTGPRPIPTGRTGDYFRERVRTELPQVIASYGDSLCVADHGLVLADRYREEAQKLVTSGASQYAVPLIFTALTESWLRQR